MLRSRLSKFTLSDWLVRSEGWQEGVKSRGGLLRVIVVQYPTRVRPRASMRAGKGGARSRQKFPDGLPDYLQT
jgi:hypothetical protein